MSLPEVLQVGTPETSYKDSPLPTCRLADRRAGVRDLEDEVDRCKEDRRDDSVPLKLPNELRRPGMNVDVAKQTRYARQGRKIASCQVSPRGKTDAMQPVHPWMASSSDRGADLTTKI